MKNIDKLIKLAKTHKIYLSCNGSILLKEYFKDITADYKNAIVPAKIESNNDKFLVLAYLTSIYEIKSEIIFSDKYTLKDHRREGAKNNIPCITAFIHCQDIKLEEELQKIRITLSN